MHTEKEPYMQRLYVPCAPKTDEWLSFNERQTSNRLHKILFFFVFFHPNTHIYSLVIIIIAHRFFFSFVFLLLCFCRAFIVYNKTTKLTENYRKKMCVWLRRLALNFTHLTLYVQIPFCYVFQLAFKYYSRNAHIPIASRLYAKHIRWVYNFWLVYFVSSPFERQFVSMLHSIFDFFFLLFSLNITLNHLPFFSFPFSKLIDSDVA